MGVAEILRLKKEAKAKKHLEESTFFLIINAKRENVVVLPSGLQYEVITSNSNSLRPAISNAVTCHYEGKLITGEVFDSSYERGKPATFQLAKVIAGWQEGLQLMDIDSEFIFYIPPHLGYGSQQHSAKIPPNSVLIFKVTLLAIQ